MKELRSVQNEWTFNIFLLLFLCTYSEGSWINSKRPKREESGYVGSMSSSVQECPPKQAKCFCGSDEDRRITVVNVKQCSFSTAWGSLCEPCKTAEDVCRKLQNCARCMPSNPQAICAQCPPDKHGLHCELERPCKAPNVSEHMTVHPHQTRRGVYKLEFRCTGGRVRHGPRNIKCQPKSGTWNRSPPKCVLPMRCSDLPATTIPFTRVKHKTSEHVVYECDVGYTASGGVLQTALQCEHGAWVQIGDSVKCEPSPKCTKMPTFLGARLVESMQVKSVYHDGERIEFTCEEGFEPVTSHLNFSLTCVEQRWVGQDPHCLLRGCPRLTVANGDVQFTDESNGTETPYVSLSSRAVVTCHEGFTLQGSPEVTCSSSAKWLPEVPQCVAKDCDETPRGEVCWLNTTTGNAVFLSDASHIYPGQVVTMGCRDGTFRRKGVGNKERICMFNGTLSGTDIKCKTGLVCKIDTTKNKTIQFCRDSGGHCIPGKDNYEDKDFEIPDDVVPVGGVVRFACKNPVYKLDSSGKTSCFRPGSTLKTPKCIPECGKRRLQKKPFIMGGEESRIEAWPWQAAIMETNGREAALLCGATIIYDLWVVTAAHCVTRPRSKEVMKTKELRVTYGMSLTKDMEAGATTSTGFEVARVIIHHQYNKDNLDHDIALLELTAPIEFNYLVGVVCLPANETCSDQRLAKGREGVVTGWGLTESEKMSEKLREVTMFVADRHECEQQIKNKGYNENAWTENMFCAESNSTKKDTTDGDSGGPFVVQAPDSELWVLEGIVSWGVHRNDNDNHNDDNNSNTRLNSHAAHDRYGSDPLSLQTCDGKACYSGYTRVAKHLDWIARETGRSSPSRCA